LSQSRVALVLVPAAAAAAGALIWLRLHFQPPTVPVYAFASDSGSAEPILPATFLPLLPGARFEVELRPATPVKGAVGARAFLLRGDEVRPWDPPFSVDADGSVRIAGPVDTLFARVPAGEWEIAVAVGRPEELPTAPRDVLRGRDAGAGPAGWRLVRERVRLGG
jgi:hypothetical protein